MDDKIKVRRDDTTYYVTRGPETVAKLTADEAEQLHAYLHVMFSRTRTYGPQDSNHASGLSTAA